MNTFRNSSILVLAVVVSSALLARAGARGGATGNAPPLSPTNFIVPAGTGEKAPNAAGFLQRWLVLEPIPANGVTQSAVQAMVKKEYFPNQFTVIPHDGDKVTVNGTELTWHALDTKFFNFSTYHYGFMFNKPTTANVLMWVVTIVNCPEEMHNVRLAIGSNDASVWWVNGQEVIGIYGDRPNIIDDGVSKKLTLKKGANVIRCALHNQQGMNDFCARFLDANDKPISNLTINLNSATN